MADLATVPKSELVARFNRMRSIVKNARQETEEITTRAMHATAAMGGGAVCGAMRGYDPAGPLMVPGTEIPADAALAAVAIAAGVTGIGGKSSDSLTAFGSGIAAGVIAFHVKEAVANRK